MEIPHVSSQKGTAVNKNRVRMSIQWVMLFGLSVRMSAPLSVTLLQIASFLFLDGIDHFLVVISPCALLQNVVLRFLIYAP